MVKIKLISLLLPVKFALNILNPVHSNHQADRMIRPPIPKKMSNGRSFAHISPLRIISKGDILISEVLFNPRPGGVDFVEIYNNSHHEIDLKELQLANVNSAGVPASIKNVSAVKLMIPAGSYFVITTNQANIKENYNAKFPAQFVQISSLPAFSNDKGAVVLLSNNVVIDQLNYSAKIHHPLIQDEDGISIERVSFSADTNEPGNFKSAAAAAGFATPTYKNSQEFSGDENFVRLTRKTFSPDGDGFDDTLNLDYQFAETSSLATVSIYTDKGRLIRKLLRNQTIGTSGTLSWDGLDDTGLKASIGIYVVVFDIFDLNGNTKRFKNTCVLAGKLN